MRGGYPSFPLQATLITSGQSETAICVHGDIELHLCAVYCFILGDVLVLSLFRGKGFTSTPPVDIDVCCVNRNTIKIPHRLVVAATLDSHSGSFGNSTNFPICLLGDWTKVIPQRVCT